jgi:MYXO-CTERM domain-containing protein
VTGAVPARPGRGWTDGNDSDPGITLVQLLAFGAALAGVLAVRRRRRRTRREGPDGGRAG